MNKVAEFTLNTNQKQGHNFNKLFVILFKNIYIFNCTMIGLISFLLAGKLQLICMKEITFNKNTTKSVHKLYFKSL